MAGSRDSEYAMALMDDLRRRVANRTQLTTDGHKADLQAVEDAFGIDVDYAMLVNLYGEPAAASSDAAARRYSPPECVGTRKETFGQARSEACQHVLRGVAPGYAADKRTLEEAGKPHLGGCASRHVLQLRAYPLNTVDLARDGGRDHGSALGND